MIGIVAPYSRSETTAAAIRLANLVLDYGVEVHLMSMGPQEQGIHPFWDQRVWTTKGDGVYFAARNCDTIVHFQPSHNVRQMCELVAEKARHILIPQIHQLRVEDTALVIDHDNVICPTKGAKQSIHEIIFQGMDLKSCPLTWARFDSGVPYVVRNGLVHGEQLRLCVLVNSSVTEVYGSMLLRLLRTLLESLSHLSVTLVSNKSWNEQDRREIRQLCDDYGNVNRFRSIREQNLDDLSREFHNHDWVMVPWTKADFGIMASRAMSCGAPVIAFDVEPFNEIITNRHNGILIPCELNINKLKAPVAVPDFVKMLNTCLSVFSENRTLFKMQASDWHLDQLEKACNRFWGQTLELFKE